MEPHPHGTEIEAFEGYLDLYRATGAPYYLKAVLGARDLYKQDWQHPGGGIVLCEHTTAEPGCGWIARRYPYNELCCAAFWINFNHRLHRLFPDVEDYVNEIERSIYNDGRRLHRDFERRTRGLGCARQLRKAGTRMARRRCARLRNAHGLPHGEIYRQGFPMRR